MTDLAGSLNFHLHRDERGLCLDVTSTRPPAARILKGMTGTQAVTLVPNLFSLCGRAQGLAARLAWDAARSGAEVAPTFHPAVAAEATVEHLWRLWVDWPQQLGLPAHLPLLAVWRRRLMADVGALSSPEFRALLSGQGLGAADVDALCQRLPNLTTANQPPPLPTLSAQQWLEAMPMPDESFACQPHWQGVAAETGAAARLTALGHALPDAPLARRLIARRRELDLLADGNNSNTTVGYASAVSPSPGVGLAAVETARGLLLHVVRADGERVADWIIVAPTEWNFRPGGPFCQLAEQVAYDRNTVTTTLPLLVLALDPCVPHRFLEANS